ncbi:MAG: hypothetical protein JWO38_1747 [Gemmataceae bacterium]|nr:hypothetical protein [Gemmataceae bacterium]
MRNSWPAAFVLAALLLWQGQTQYQRAEVLTNTPRPGTAKISDPDFEEINQNRRDARTAENTGLVLTVAGGVAAVVGIAILAYSMGSRKRPHPAT